MPAPCRGEKPLPEQLGWLGERVLGVCTTSSMRFPIRRAGAEQEGCKPAPGWATQGLTLGRVPPGKRLCRTSHGRWPPRNSFLSSSALFICCLPRLSLPSQPSPAGKAFPLKGEREGREEMEGRRGKKNKIKSKGEAKLCQGWAAAKPSPRSAPPVHPSRALGSPQPTWERVRPQRGAKPQAEGCARVCVYK